MSEYDQTFDPKVLIGRFDLISLFIFITKHMSEYDHTFDHKEVFCHCELSSWFSGFALYLDTLSVYKHTPFTI